MPDGSNNPSSLVIPDHQLIARVGAGSYGEVWLAQSLTGSFRAVKIIFRDRFKDARPFEREFQGILKFEPISRSHPGVVAILHVGRREDEGYFYYVMEVADDLHSGHRIDSGSYTPHTLAATISGGRKLPVRRCIDYGLSLTSALEHFHNNGLAHRDIKPSNIIFVRGQPKLADIGMVAGIGGERTYLGTHGYIPPEGAGTPQADLYSLGKVLYEAASGNDSAKYPELPSDIAENPEAQRFFDLNEVLVKACASEAWRRYESAAAMRADLEALKKGRPLRRANDRKERRRQIQLAAMVAIVVAMSSMAAFAWKKRVTAEADLETIRHSERVSIPPPKITKQPASGTVLEGSPVTMSASAAGDSLRYQWFRNGQGLPGETNQVLRIARFTAKDVGRYTAQIAGHRSVRRVLTEPADWAVAWLTHEKLLNIQFGAPENERKGGPAAVGASDNDVWNVFRNDASNQTLQNLKWSNGKDSGAALSIVNLGAAKLSSRGEPLLRTFASAAKSSGDIVAKISNLPAQEYDVYVYAHGKANEENSEIELRMNGAFVAKKATTTKPDWEGAGWSEGVEFVLFRNVFVPEAADLEMISHPGAAGVAVINGIQLVKARLSVH